MGLKSTKREFPARLDDLSGVISHFTEHFEKKDFTVKTENIAGGVFISLTKGGIFKAVAGMKTGLNITLTQKPEAIEAAMEVGIFGKQAVATAITLLIAWPVIIPQIIGLIQQNKLDEEAYQVIEEGIRSCERMFCQYCGASVSSESIFCANCGKKIAE